MYTYGASSTGFSQCFPAWFTSMGGTARTAIIRDNDPRAARVYAYARAQLQMRIDQDPMVIQIASWSNHNEWLGKRLGEVLDVWYADRGKSTLENAVDFVVRGYVGLPRYSGETSNMNNPGSILYHYISEPDIKALMMNPWVSIASDGSLSPSASSHPRSSATFPRLFRKYVREEYVVSPEEAIRKVTTLPADQMRLTDRGMIKVGYWADVTIFDEDEIYDLADFASANVAPVGIDYVIVNGVIAVDHGVLTPARAGKALRGPGYEAPYVPPSFSVVVPDGFNSVTVKVDGNIVINGIAQGEVMKLPLDADKNAEMSYGFGSTKFLPVTFALNGANPFNIPAVQGFDVAALKAAEGVDQIVVAVSTGKSPTDNAQLDICATVTRGFDKVGALWVEKIAALGHVGRTGVKDLGVKREGDGGTPSGVYELARPFGILADPGSLIQPYVVVVRNEDYWIDDVAFLGGKYYNEWVKKSELVAAGEIAESVNLGSFGEHLAATSPSYNYAFVIEYNTGSGTRVDETGKGFGSAIFMHRQGNNPGSTAGCINMTQADMEFMLKFVKPGTQIVISPSIAYLDAINAIGGPMTPEEALAFHYNTLVLDTHTDILNRTTIQGTNIYLPLDRPFNYTGTNSSHASIVDNGKNMADLSVDLTFDALNLNASASNPTTSRLRMMDFTKMASGGLDVAFYAAYTEGSGATTAAFDPSAIRSRSRSLSMINTLYWNARKSGDLFSVVTASGAVKPEVDNGKLVVIPSIEGGTFVTPANGIEIVRQYYDLGVRLFLPCYSTNGYMGRGVSNSALNLANIGMGENEGLSQLGKDVVKELGKLGVVVDVSHAHELSFWDIIEAAKVGNDSYPVIASHSSCKALTNAARNLTDEQIIALARTGGVVQLAFERSFVTTKPAAQYMVSDIIDHLDYAVALLDNEFGPGQGVNYLGFGSDFDGGITTPADMPTAAEMYKLTLEMAARGYKADEMAKILGGNMMRVLAKAEAMADAKNISTDIKITPVMDFDEYGYYVNNHRPLFKAFVEGDITDSKIIVDGISYPMHEYDGNLGVLMLQLPETFASTDVRDAFHVMTYEVTDLSGAVARETIIFYVDVTKVKPVTSIKLETVSGPVPSIITVPRNSVYQLHAIMNDGASNAGLVWTISDTSYADVDANGKVTIKNKQGIIILTVKDTATGTIAAVSFRIS
jgi:membrane dipeptidase